MAGRSDGSPQTAHRPNPHRITVALDRAKLFGPGADAKLGAREPDLDNWEAGRSEPSVAQLAKLGRMANVPVTFFYLPDDAQPELSVARVCMRGRSRLIVSMCADVLDSAPQPTLFEDLR